MRYGWNINSAPWERAGKELQKLEWKKVFLDPSQTFVIPEKSGVYLICGRPPVPVETDLTKPLAIFYNVLYAGQSGSLRARFATHAKSTSPDCVPVAGLNTFPVLPDVPATIEPLIQ